MGLPTHISRNTLDQPVYEGSVQRLYSVPGAEDWLVSETTESGSVFDVGAFFSIDGADECRATFRHLAYLRLASADAWQELRAETGGSPDALWQGEPAASFLNYGAPTHHIGQIDGETGEISMEEAAGNRSRYNVIRRFRVIHPLPASVSGRPVYDYTSYRGEDGYVIPLEFLVRFGLTPASSVYQKYVAADDVTRRKISGGEEWSAWQLFSAPKVDYSTKYEPEDRSLTVQEALLISGQTAAKLDEAAKMAALGGCMIRSMLARTGLTLWDLKWEFAAENDRLFFVDTIDTDSLRATLPIEKDGVTYAINFNKQAMRDYFRLADPAWFAALGQAKRLAAEQGCSFSALLREGQESGRWPSNPVAPLEFTRLQGQKLNAIVDFLAGRTGEQEAAALLRQLGMAELDFYQTKGLLEGYAAWNRLPDGSSAA